MTPYMQKPEPDEPKTHNFTKGIARLMGGGILLLIGSSTRNNRFVKAGNLGVAKGFHVLFTASSAAIWKKIPFKNNQKDKMAKVIQTRKPIIRKIMLALSCATVTVLTIVYYTKLNAPDISLRVATMQTGIKASNFSNMPPDFSLTEITSMYGKITLNYKNHTTGDGFSLIKEKSSWDSNTLLTSFVKNNYSNDYATIRKQGLTIYIDGSNASWIDGGVVHKIVADSDSLTKEQIISIAVSS